jgi:hypothetical protein
MVVELVKKRLTGWRSRAMRFANQLGRDHITVVRACMMAPKVLKI